MAQQQKFRRKQMNDLRVFLEQQAIEKQKKWIRERAEDKQSYGTNIDSKENTEELEKFKKD